MLKFQPLRGSRRSRVNRVIVASKLLRFALIGLVGFIIFFFIALIWISKDLPTPGKLSSPDISDSTRILDKDGNVLFSFYKDYNRLYIPLSEVPKSLKDATIATEDKDFYENQGYSILGYMRALKDFMFYRRVTGGSTITQQLVKNVLLTPERSVTRKLKEFVLAIQVDRRFSKDQILEMYMNNVGFGGTAVGVEAASNMYFNKSAKDLSLSESAFLAGLPQSPTYYSPFSGEKRYVVRSLQVLKRMEEEGLISKTQSEEALKQIESYKFTRQLGSLKAPHFVMYVKSELDKMFGESYVDKGNLKVTTTLDYDIQKKAEETVLAEIEKLKGLNVGNGAAIVLNSHDSSIVAMVGSRDYFDIENEGNFNASLSLRQPGSALKPIMYATAFEKGYTPATLLMDVKTDFPTNDPKMPTYTPVNYDGKYRGPMQIRFALGNSINVPAVKMLARIGIKPVMQKAYDMGIENWRPTTENLKNVGYSLVLGGREASLLQMSQAYSVFARGGIKKSPFAILEVKDEKGKVLYKHEEDKGSRVLSAEASFLITHILLDNNAREIVFGTSSLLNIPGKSVSAKTGTTDSKRDNWAFGYNEDFTVGAWVGNNDNTPMNPKIASGVTGATPIWNKIMTAVLKDKKDKQTQKPDNVEAVEIDAFSGGLIYNDQPKRTEYFIKGTQPSTVSPVYKKIKISRHDTNKLANAEEISKGEYDVKEFVVFSEDDPVSSDGENRWQKAINEWINQNYKDDPKYHPPTDTSDKKYEEKKESDTAPTPTSVVTSTPTPTSLLPTITP